MSIISTIISAFTHKHVQANTYAPFVVYYNNEAAVADFAKYKLLILDSDTHPPLHPLADRDKVLLGYVSLGEVSKDRKYFGELQKQNILLNENKQWPGSYTVDIRNNYWPQFVIESIIPNIIRSGFHGIFIDTLDNPADYERKQPLKYGGMGQAAIQLVKSIRLHYPDLKIMLNRGYEILPYVVKDIDMVLGESVYADYNFETKVSSLNTPELYHQQLKILQDAKFQNHNLGVYTLDYWDKNDAEGIKKIYQEQRDNGFVPYVSTISLNEIVAEPE